MRSFFLMKPITVYVIAVDINNYKRCEFSKRIYHKFKKIPKDIQFLLMHQLMNDAGLF